MDLSLIVLIVLIVWSLLQKEVGYRHISHAKLCLRFISISGIHLVKYQHHLGNFHFCNIETQTKAIIYNYFCIALEWR